MAIQQMTREEYEKKYSVRPFSTSTIKPEEVGNEGNFLTGLAKSGLSTVKGTLQLGEKLGGSAIIKGIDKLTGNKNKVPLPSESKFLSEESIKTRGTGEKIGKFVGDVAQFAIPGTKVGKATQALSTIPKIATRALTSGAIGAAQTGDLKGGAFAAGGEALAPGISKVAGFVTKPVSALMGRLFKGVGSGLSGASSKQIEGILANPKAAQQAVKEIKSVGGASILRKNATAIVEGVSKIRQDARKAFGEGLEALSKEDINPAVFRQEVGGVLNKFGSTVKNGVRRLENAEFNDPKNVKKASELIKRLSTSDLDGKSLRKLADDIESAKFRTATSDERLAFNVFLKDLSSGLKTAVSKSTNKLDEINKAFSGEMGLAEEVQQIFGNVKFKNAKEILKVSQRLESLFSQKGLAPEATDSFLTRIGIEPSDFRATEATRQMGELAPASNTIGTSPFEIVRAFTSAIVPPSAVRSLAIKTGIAQNVIEEIARKLSPIARATFVRLLVGNPSPDPNQDQNNE